MNTAVALLLGLAAGSAIGALYFGWLWWSLKALTGGQASVAGFALQTLGRYLVAAAGFALVAQGLGWQPVAAALAGFIGVRLLMQRRLAGPDGNAGGRPASGPVRASERPEDRA